MVRRLQKKNHVLVIVIAALVFLAAFTGCENFTLYKELGMDYLSAGGFMLVPQSPTLVVDKTLVFSVVGGTPPFEYSIVNPDIASGTIDSVSGLYTAPSSGPHTDVVKVLDSEGLIRTVSILVVNPDALQIVPAMATISTNDIFYFSAIGGTAPYQFAVTSGGGTIDINTGEFHAPGSPSTTNVRVTDGDTTSANATITTREGLVIIPQLTSIPANNNIAFTASGGVPPYSFVLESGFGTVDTDGLYKAPASVGTDKVRVTDSAGNSRIATINITAAQPLNIVPSSFIMITNTSFQLSALGGTPPYTYTKLSGNGSITAGGAFTSSGTTGKTFVRVTDSKMPTPLTADGEITIVSFGPLAIIPGPVIVEQGKTFTFSASGGTPQYTYSVPNPGTGIIISSTGEYTAPLTIGSETVRVTDVFNDTSDAVVNIVPAAPSNLVLTSPANGFIKLDWYDNSTGEDGFVIQRKTSGLDFADLVTVPFPLPANTTSYTDSGLNPVEAFGYRVRAYSGALDSGYSNEDFRIPKP